MTNVTQELDVIRTHVTKLLTEAQQVTQADNAHLLSDMCKGVAAGLMLGTSLRHWVGLPDMPETISGAETLRKGTPQWFAMAFARAVLPQPGGPCSRTPLGGSTPSQAYT